MRVYSRPAVSICTFAAQIAFNVADMTQEDAFDAVASVEVRRERQKTSPTSKKLAALKGKRSAIVSLHGCGDVQQALLRGFRHSNASQVCLLVTLGCCYHKAKKTQENAWTLSETIKRRLSDVFLNASALRLASECDLGAHCKRSPSARRSHVFACISRAAIELFYEEMGASGAIAFCKWRVARYSGIDASSEPRARRRQYGANYEEIKQTLVTRNDIQDDETRKRWFEHFDAICTRIEPHIPRVEILMVRFKVQSCPAKFCFQHIRRLLQSPLERLLLVDRLCYLKEAEISASIVQVFPSTFSARNHAIVAHR